MLFLVRGQGRGSVGGNCSVCIRWYAVRWPLRQISTKPVLQTKEVAGFQQAERIFLIEFLIFIYFHYWVSVVFSFKFQHTVFHVLGILWRSHGAVCMLNSRTLNEISVWDGRAPTRQGYIYFVFENLYSVLRLNYDNFILSSDVYSYFLYAFTIKMQSVWNNIFKNSRQAFPWLKSSLKKASFLADNPEKKMFSTAHFGNSREMHVFVLRFLP